MALIQVAKFGPDKEGIHTFRVNGDKADLEKIIQETKDIGWIFWEEPTIEKVFKWYSVLMKIYDPKEYYKERENN